MRKSSLIIFVTLLLYAGVVSAAAQPLEDVKINYNLYSETAIEILSVTNNHGFTIWLSVGELIISDIQSGETKYLTDSDGKGYICDKVLAVADNNNNRRVLWTPGDTALEWKKRHLDSDGTASTNSLNQRIKATLGEIARKLATPNRPLGVESAGSVGTEDGIGQELPIEAEKNTGTVEEDRKSQAKLADVEAVFRLVLEGDPYYADTAIEQNKEAFEQYSQEIKAFKDDDKEGAANFVEKNHLTDSLQFAEKELNAKKAGVQEYVDNFVDTQYGGYNNIQQQNLAKERMLRMLEDKLKRREESVITLRRALRRVNREMGGERLIDRILENKLLLMNGSIGMGALIFILLLIALLRKRKASKKPTVIPKEETATNAASASPNIVVRRKTTSILKKQSLEDVQGNNAYLAIDCADFCNDSAVRRIYLKNSCIKEIYNMYADDLRDANNPKEDGCMVLGRWVEDPDTHEYYVSLEHVVLPGDDAVFQEYELNFGGKIKLRVAEKLRKLRRETDLQYDMTCWVHSHPGLGVFFSNSDHGVHTQLKHPTHPKFLTAIVVDILTPQMELGIFTFKRSDMLVNAKPDLKRMYSLEDWYHWALESERNSYREDNYLDILSSAELHDSACASVRMNNGSIIDACHLLEYAQVGMGFHCGGFSVKTNRGTDYIVEKVTTAETARGMSINGYFLVGNYLSIPTIRKGISALSTSVGFVLFYSLADATVTCIPIVDGAPVMDEKYYSKQQMEDLKIWTRRKR